MSLQKKFTSIFPFSKFFGNEIGPSNDEENLEENLFWVNAALNKINYELTQAGLESYHVLGTKENQGEPVILTNNSPKAAYNLLYELILSELDKISNHYVATINQDKAVTIWHLNPTGAYKSYLALVKVNIRVYARYSPSFSQEPRIFLNFNPPNRLNIKKIQAIMSPEEYRRIFVLQELQREVGE
ncbi:MAG: hypothetical protein PVJ09_04055 [Candidatus Woesebacteria bacterium]|jgi:hypothetical protein